MTLRASGTALVLACLLTIPLPAWATTWGGTERAGASSDRTSAPSPAAAASLSAAERFWSNAAW